MLTGAGVECLLAAAGVGLQLAGLIAVGSGQAVLATADRPGAAGVPSGGM